LLIIIPARNEQKTILKVFNECQIYSEVIIINDSSDDETKNILLHNEIPFVENVNRLGYENSLIVGINYAIKNNFTSVCFIDADSEIPSHYISKIIKFKDEYDIIIGNRNMKKRLLEKFLSFFYKNLFNIDDPLCGLKYFKLKKINIKFKNLNTYSIKILNSFLTNESKILNFEVKLNKLRADSRLGNVFLVNLKLILCVFISLIFYLEYKIKKN